MHGKCKLNNRLLIRSKFTTTMNNEDVLDETDLGDFQKLLNRFNMMSSEKTSIFFK
jgi:hypothetical protein